MLHNKFVAVDIQQIEGVYKFIPALDSRLQRRDVKYLCLLVRKKIFLIAR